MNRFTNWIKIVSLAALVFALAGCSFRTIDPSEMTEAAPSETVHEPAASQQETDDGKTERDPSTVPPTEEAGSDTDTETETETDETTQEPFQTEPPPVTDPCPTETIETDDVSTETSGLQAKERLQAALDAAHTYLPAIDSAAWHHLEDAVAAAEDALAHGRSGSYEEVMAALESAMAEMDARFVVKNGVTYVDGILIINKTYGAPKSFAPGNDKTARAALDRLIEAATADGVTMEINNGYRSYSSQEKLYDYYVKRDGKAAADTYSARPGYSEHQSGLVYDMEAWDETSPQALWLDEHCWEYGFIIRYPKGKDDETGYSYEAWHLRYVGVDVSLRLRELGMTLEKYLGITSRYEEG